MSEYTPSTDEIRLAYALSRDNRSSRADQRNTDLWDEICDAAFSNFSRWLAAHDAATRTAALEEAAVIAEEARTSAALQLRETDFPDSHYSQWVSGKCDMAAAIEIIIRAEMVKS